MGKCNISREISGITSENALFPEKEAPFFSHIPWSNFFPKPGGPVENAIFPEKKAHFFSAKMKHSFSRQKRRFFEANLFCQVFWPSLGNP